MKIVCLDACHCPVPAFDVQDQQYTEYSNTRREEINTRIEDASIIITTRVAINEENILVCKNLKMVAVMAAGTDIIDRAACKSRGVVVCNIPSASAESVAEHAFALYFAVKRKVVELHNLTLRGKEWPAKRTAIHTFNGLPRTCRMDVLGVVGYGTLGKRIETIAKALGMSFIAAERKGSRGKPRPGRTAFEETLRSCSVLILTCPLDETTRGMIGETELRLMQKDSILINVARGGVVNEEALVRALKEGWINGAATDVFAVEPVDTNTSPLVTVDDSIPNLTLSPHVAWYARSSTENLQAMIKSNIEEFVLGRPQNII